MEAITIVSGLPRSGTSMMMRMLHAGGIDVVADHLRQADEDNPKGYFEFERVKHIKDDRSWLADARGRVVKMVSMLLYDLPGDTNYRIVFMRRAMNEILASQKVMLERMGKGGDFDIEEMAALFSKHLAEIEAWLTEQKNMQILFVNYRDVLDAPQPTANAINSFLGGSLNVPAMIEVVDASLYRQRGDALNNIEGKEATPSGSSDEDRIREQLQALGYM